MKLELLKSLFQNHKESQLFGRYIFSEHIYSLMERHQEHFKIRCIGTSVLDEDIHVIEIGNGPRKILMWSQMHGNETTTTKAVFDVCNVFAFSKNSEIKFILNNCTIAIIPMLNPDGAKAYTRVNANGIDLNRDAKNLSQPESQVLRTYFNAFKPDFCFNLHGQRTIFSAGYTKYPATVSFLAPAQDEQCTVIGTRKKAMEIIVKMNENLQIQIPRQVGIYDDAFNLNCVGDTFQSLEVPTVLFEAGHYANDYNREVVREFVFQSLMVAIEYISSHSISGQSHEPYFDIPQNQKLFYDIIIRNAKVKNESKDIAIQYEERLWNKKIDFVPIVDKISDLKDFFGHKEFNANGCNVCTQEGRDIYEGYENVFVLINNEKLSVKP